MREGSTLNDSVKRPYVAIILAAGEGKRYGRNKISAAKLDGVPIGLLTAQTYQQVLPTRVVVRKGDEINKTLFQEAGFEVVIAEYANRGMGNSIAAGVAAIEKLGFEGCLIGLGDMPFVSVTTLRVLLAQLSEGQQLVRPRYKGKPGNPVGFGREFFEILANLREDQGARDVLETRREQITYCDVNDPGVITDIDTPHDLAAAQQQQQQ